MRNLLILLFVSFSACGQNEYGSLFPENRVVVIGQAQIDLPADRVICVVRLEYEHPDSIQVAYAQHKIAEEKLVRFLEEAKIPNKNIKYSLLDLMRERNSNSRFIFTTHQSVLITIEDLKEYTPFVLKLVQAGFKHITSNFSTSKENDFHSLLIQKAVEAARRKADEMAKAGGREVDKMLKVSDTSESDPTFPWYQEIEVRGYGSQKYLNFDQTVQKKMQVKVTYSLK